MTRTQLHIFMLLMSGAAIGLTAIAFNQDPTTSTIRIVGIIAIPIIWIIASFIDIKSKIYESNQQSWRFFSWSVLLAAFILLFSQGLKTAESLSLFETTNTDRIWGITMGLVLMIMGNYIPKVIGPLDRVGCNQNAVEKLQRFSGGIFVLAGIGYVASWIFLPISYASWVATSLCAIATAIVVIRRISFAISNKGIV